MKTFRNSGLCLALLDFQSALLRLNPLRSTCGEVAVFVVQRIAEKNWYSYDGNNDKLKVIAQKKAAAKVLLLKNVIEDKEMCKELQFYFKRQYNLKNKVSQRSANNGSFL